MQTEIVLLSPEDLQKKIYEVIEVFAKENKQQPVESQPEQLIYGIKGLAKFLNCCNKTAGNIKDSGIIPYTQFNNIIIFKSSDVLNYKKNDIFASSKRRKC